MAARFPQSGSSLGWRIKPEWASKIHVLYWAAGVDSVHRLRSGDTATAIVTRSASGATFDATNGRIDGTSTTLFSDSIAGGYGALTESSDYVFGASLYGDFFNGLIDVTFIRSEAAPDASAAGFALQADTYSALARVQNGTISTFSGIGFSDDVQGWMVVAVRNQASDATAKQRAWVNGSEHVGSRANVTPNSSVLIGTAARPLYFGGSKVGTGNTKTAFEFAFLGAVALTDADLAAITADPSILVELTPAVIEVNPVGADSTQSATSGVGAVEVTSIPIVNLVGSDSTQASTSGTGAISTTVGTLTSSPMKSWFTKLLRPNETGIDVFVYDKTGGDTGDKTVKLTGQSNNASAVWSASNGLFVAGRSYRLGYKLADGSEGWETVIAT